MKFGLLITFTPIPYDAVYSMREGNINLPRMHWFVLSMKELRARRYKVRVKVIAAAIAQSIVV